MPRDFDREHPIQGAGGLTMQGAPGGSSQHPTTWDEVTGGATVTTVSEVGSSPSDDCAAADPLPGRIGRYRISGRLGQGGMGEVYAAVDERLERPVAIKRVGRKLTRDPEVRARFWREARILAGMDHPGFVTVYELGETPEGDLFIAMELVDGLPLKALADHPWPVEHACRLVARVAEAMGAAHAAGIVHRDIKPDNVLLESDGTVRVVDFGVARRHDTSGDTLTATGLMVGTPAYMSPEQVTSRPATPASDVFSMGILLYRLITGRLPFDGDSQIAVAMAIARGEHVPIEQIRPELPPRLIAIVNRCLEQDPSARFPDGSALANALRGLIDQESGSSGEIAWKTFIQERARATTHNHTTSPSNPLVPIPAPLVPPVGTHPDPPSPGARTTISAEEQTTFARSRAARAFSTARWLAPVAVTVALLLLAARGIGLLQPEGLDGGPDAPALAPGVIVPPRPVVAVLGFAPSPRGSSTPAMAGGGSDVRLGDLARVLGDAVRVVIDGVPEQVLSLSSQTLAALGLSMPFSGDLDELDVPVRPHRGPGHVDAVLVGNLAWAGDQVVVQARLWGTRPRTVWAAWETRVPAQDPLAAATAVGRTLLRILTQPSDQAGPVQSQDTSEGADATLQVLQVPTRSLDAYIAFLDAQALLEQGDLSAAREGLEWALQLDPDFALAEAERLGILRAERRMDEVAARGQALLEHPERLPPRMLAKVESLTAYAGGRPRRAVAILHQVLERWPYDIETYQHLVMMRSNNLDTVDLAEVERLSRRALEIAPRHEVMLSRLVRAMAWRGRADEAARLLEQMGIDPAEDEFSVNPWALTYLFLGDYDRSRQLFERTLSQVQDDIFAFHHLVILDILQDRCVQATDRALNRIHRIETMGKDANLTWTYSLALQGLFCQSRWSAAATLLDAWRTRHGLDPVLFAEFAMRIAAARGDAPDSALDRINSLLDAPLDDPAEDRSPLLRQVAAVSRDPDILEDRAAQAGEWAVRVDVPSAIRNSYRQAQTLLQARALLERGAVEEALDRYRGAVYPWSEVQSEGDLGRRVEAMAHLARALDRVGRKTRAEDVWRAIRGAGYERLWVTDLWVEAVERLGEDSTRG